MVGRLLVWIIDFGGSEGGGRLGNIGLFVGGRIFGVLIFIIMSREWGIFWSWWGGVL